MACPYTDEELERLYPELPDDGRGGWSRLLNTLHRLRCERDEARGDAYALAAYATHCDEPQTENKARAMLAALAYPEVKP